MIDQTRFLACKDSNLKKDTKQPMLTRRTPSAPKQSFPTLHPFTPVGSIYVRIQVTGVIKTT